MFAATYFGANGWLLEFGGLRVLVDPWLRGDLVFPPGAWFFTGSLAQSWPVPAALDLLLLTQGLPDHCHPPSLQLLDRGLPVVGSRSAAERVRSMGFAHVTALSPGQSHTLVGADGSSLRIEAVPGAAVPQVENGYVLEHSCGSLYLEPHGFLADASTLPPRRLDAVITPVVDLGLPVAGAFVKGRSVLPELLQRFQPRVVLASTAGGDVRYQGLLTRFLWQQGTPSEAADEVRRLHPACLLLDPDPGVRLDLETPAGTQPEVSTP